MPLERLSDDVYDWQLSLLTETPASALPIVVDIEDGSIKAIAPFDYTPPSLDVSAAVPSTAEAHRQAVLTWRREGDAAGFCGDVRVYESGYVEITSCRENAPLVRRWASEELVERLHRCGTGRRQREADHGCDHAEAEADGAEAAEVEGVAADVLAVVAVLDVEGFPILRHWFLVHPKSKELSLVARTFLDFTVDYGPRLRERMETMWPALRDVTDGPKPKARKARKRAAR